MITFLVTTAIVMLVLGLVSFLSSKRSDHGSDQASALSLLPGDIKYEFLEEISASTFQSPPRS